MKNIKITNLWYGNRTKTHYMVIADSQRFGDNEIMYEGTLSGCILWLRRKGINSYKAAY